MEAGEWASSNLMMGGPSGLRMPTNICARWRCARLYFDNIKNMQSSWVTMGPKVGQLALFFGANDMGSVMMEENVVSSAGTTYRLDEAMICRLIRDAGGFPASGISITKCSIATMVRTRRTAARGSRACSLRGSTKSRPEEAAAYKAAGLSGTPPGDQAGAPCGYQ